VPIDLDQDALHATIDLVGRTGATQLQFGYLHDDVPVHQADWWAHAQYRGARIAVEHHAGPIEALEALARRLLTGAKCKCGKLVALSDTEAVAFEGRLLDGTTWTPQQAAAAGQCRWHRNGPRWTRGCELSAAQPNRATRRKKKR
jgi:hypothetical protein